jgi:hypothetical protein
MNCNETKDHPSIHKDHLKRANELSEFEIGDFGIKLGKLINFDIR